MSDLEDAVSAAFQNVEGVILAVSGGVDSMVMLHAFSRVKPCPAVVCHVDHHLRRDSTGDASFTQFEAKRHGLGYACVDLEIENEGSVQNRARSQRLAALRGVAYRKGYNAVATAHHHDDWVENFFLSTSRGAGFETIEQAYRNEHDNITWIKPLTYLSKDAIKQYAITNQISWRTDPTNAKPDYARNRVRAALQSSTDSHGDGTLASRERFEQGAKIIRDAAQSALRFSIRECEIPNAVALDRDALLSVQNELVSEVIRYAARALGVSMSAAAVTTCIEVVRGEISQATPKDLFVTNEGEQTLLIRNFGRGAQWFDTLRTPPRADLVSSTNWFGGRFERSEKLPKLKPHYWFQSAEKLNVRGWTSDIELPASVKKNLKRQTRLMRWSLPVVFQQESPCWIPGVWKAESSVSEGPFFVWIPDAV